MPKKHRRPSANAADREQSLFTPPASAAPLAARMRPRTLDEFVGQEQVLAPGKPLRQAIETGTVGSLVFWGPPGTGKTTLGRLIAEYTDREFVPFSAVTEGVGRVREVVAEAAERLELGRGTILFVDEIHRFNRAQQDAFLPHVESGTITLVGATTENPSFEINSALLSRMRVFVLEPLSEDALRQIVRLSLDDNERGLGSLQLAIDDAALDLLVSEADGDARRALTALEAAGMHLGDAESADGAGVPAGSRLSGRSPRSDPKEPSTVRRVIDVATVKDALQKRFAHHDKSGEWHFNMLSALHKSLRGSDPQGALYWMARLIEGGEDPMVIFRRSLAMAAEDIGVADPNALQVAVAARQAYHVLGPPEGYLPLAEMIVYLATAPKSNSAYMALGAAMDAARETPAEPVPLHIRNAPTKLMKDLGYHEGYQYAHSDAAAYIPQEYLPEKLRGAEFYKPGPFGFEKEIAKRLQWWADLRSKVSNQPSPRGDSSEKNDKSPPGGTADGEE
ncbi:MAG TPA: replication-associated recombination protein A [Gemmatimonadaceae bacterium]|nr:replication-associated recombination protein A [Gemmatimonadaceae bacterium]